MQVHDPQKTGAMTNTPAPQTGAGCVQVDSYWEGLYHAIFCRKGC